MREKSSFFEFYKYIKGTSVDISSCLLKMDVSDFYLYFFLTVTPHLNTGTKTKILKMFFLSAAGLASTQDSKSSMTYYLSHVLYKRITA